MVEITARGNSFILRFGAEQAQKLGLDSDKEYELTRARDGVWVLVENGYANSTAAKGPNIAPALQEQKKDLGLDELEQKIIGILRKSELRDRIEGWFEKKLSEDEKKKFSQMLSEGKILKFKSNESYKKALYTLPKTAVVAAGKKSPTAFENREKPFEEFTLEKDGFVVVKSEPRAKVLSEDLKPQIKSGEIRGTRAFTGEFYVIHSTLLDPSMTKVLDEMKKNRVLNIDDIAKKTGLIPTLIRIAMEFLKEEGQIIEKRKDAYQYIE